MVALGAAMAGLAWRAPHQDGRSARCRGGRSVLIVGARVCSGWRCAGWASCRCWWWWCSPPPGPAATPACAASVPLALGIAVFCSGLFIKGLGLPLPLIGPWLSPAYWSPPPPPPRPPTPRPRPGAVREPRAMELLDHLGLGFATALSALEPALRLRRLPARHGRGRAAGPGAARHHRHAPAADLLAAAGLGPDHAGRASTTAPSTAARPPPS